MPPFLTLDDCLLHPLLAPVMAVFMVLGLAGITFWLAAWAAGRTGDWRPLDTITLFFVVAGVLGSALQAMALFGLTPLGVVRPLAGLLAVAGAAFLAGVVRRRAWHPFTDACRTAWREGDAWTRAALLLHGAIVPGLLLNALSPATEADSLAYHLGGALEMLRHGGVYYRPDWLDWRLLGSGECLNMLGLGGGTDCFGSLLQWSGLVALAWGITQLTTDPARQRFLSTAVFATPMLVMLVNAPKPQMFPIGACVLGLVQLVTRRAAPDFRTFALAYGAFGCAMTMKLSFVLTAGIASLYGIGVAWTTGRRGACALAILLGAVFILLPVFGKNWYLFGDPLTPTLERFRPHPDLFVVRFARYLQTFSLNDVPFPLSLVVPDRNFHNILGLGALLFFLVLPLPGGARRFLLVAILAAGATFALGQRTPRFFLESYFWILCAAASLPDSRPAAWLWRGLVLQMVPVAGIAWFGVVTLLPGTFSPAWRDAVLRKTAFGYSECQWLDAVLPPDARVVYGARGSVFLPRPFFSGAIFSMVDLADPGERQKLLAMLREFRPTHVTSYRELDLTGLDPAAVGKAAETRDLRTAGRKPWWQGQPYSLFVWRIDPDRLSDSPSSAASWTDPRHRDDPDSAGKSLFLSRFDSSPPFR